MSDPNSYISVDFFDCFPALANDDEVKVDADELGKLFGNLWGLSGSRIGSELKPRKISMNIDGKKIIKKIKYDGTVSFEVKEFVEMLDKIDETLGDDSVRFQTEEKLAVDSDIVVEDQNLF